VIGHIGKLIWIAKAITSCWAFCIPNYRGLLTNQIILMKKEAIINQILILILGLSLIFTLRGFLRDKIIVEAMKVQSETMASRAECFANAREKNINDGDCMGIDVTAYKLYPNY